MKKVALTVILVVLAALALASSAPASTAGQLANGGPSAHAAGKAPNVRCMRLDRAERKLHRLGFRTREHGGGLFGIVIKADWVVVHQSQRGSTVHLTAGRYC
jgi:hypothetical protein